MKRLKNIISFILIFIIVITELTVIGNMSGVEAANDVLDVWDFNTEDVSEQGNKTKAEFVGNVSIVDDEIFGKVLSFANDNRSYMKVKDYINAAEDNYSFSLWYKLDKDISGSNVALLQQDGIGRTLLSLRPDGKYLTYVNASNVISDNSASKGEWQHVSISFDQASKNVKFYINGVLDSTQTLNGTPAQGVTSLLVGTHKNIGNNDPRGFAGLIDDIRVFDRIVSDEEVKSMYEEKAIILLRKKLLDLLDQSNEALNSDKIDEAQEVFINLKSEYDKAMSVKDSTQLELISETIASLEKALNAYLMFNPITLIADSEKITNKINPDEIFGINHRYAFNGYGTFNPDTMEMNPKFVDLYKQVGFGSIRYPGGTISNLFNWKETIGAKELRSNQIHGFYDNPNQSGIPANFGLTEIANFADDANSEIIYVYGIGRGSAMDASDLIEYLNAKVGTNPNGGVDWARVRADNGHFQPYNIKYFEIGNEPQQNSNGNGDGTWSQGYWLDYTGANEKSFVEGAVVNMVNQIAVKWDDWNSRVAITDSTPNQVRYMKYANVNPKKYENGKLTNDSQFVSIVEGSARDVTVGGESWEIVDSLTNFGADDKVVEIDYSNGAIKFGDGVHGAIPKAGSRVNVSYQVKRDGFIDISKSMRDTMNKINELEGKDDPIFIYSGYESIGFINRMDQLNSNDLYDGVAVHPYSGTPNGRTDEEFYDNAMLLAESSGVGKVKNIANELPQGKVPVISEFGIFRSTSPLLRAQTHALYITKVMTEYVKLGSPYIQKHTLVDWYSSGADALGPTQQAVIQAVAQEGASTLTGEGDFEFFITPQALAIKMFNDGFGSDILESELSNMPELSNGAKALSHLVSKDNVGNLYIALTNVDRTNPYDIILDLKGHDLKDKQVLVRTLYADINAENSLENPYNVQIAETEEVSGSKLEITLEPHSFKIVEVKNALETIEEPETPKETEEEPETPKETEEEPEIPKETEEELETPIKTDIKGFLSSMANVRELPNGPIIGTALKGELIEGEYEEGSNWVKFDYYGKEAYVHKSLLIDEKEIKGFVKNNTNIRQEPNGKIVDLLEAGKYVEGTININNLNWVKISEGYIYKPLVVNTLDVEGLASSLVNIRQIPNGKIIGLLEIGEYVKGYVDTDNPNWIRISHNGKTGYVSRALISDKVKLRGIISTLSNVRQEPNGKIVGRLKLGDLAEGTVHLENRNWLKIRYNGKDAYVYRYLLEDKVQLSGKALSAINVRRTPNGTIIGILKKGSQVKGKITVSNPNWIEIQYNGKRAYVYKTFVK